jgi:glucuronoarabinoxylan endo-1,4-beta-xylanase
MKFRPCCIGTSILLVALSIASAQSTATVSFGTTKQTIRGFGGSEAWMPQFSSAEADTLFGTGSGQLGLSILRLRIDPSSTTGGSNWATELTNAQMAHTLGATVIATPWTPPAAWKSSNSTVEGTLNTSEYAAYANYLNLFTAYLAAGGVPLYAISMQNEPDANVTYESCVWTGATMDAWIAQNASVLTTKLMMPESESFNTSFSDPALDDANAVGNISIIAGHLYGTSPSFYTNAVNKGKEVWETEHYLTPSASTPAIGDAISAAEEIHNSMTVGQYNAYLWWWVADWNPGSGVTNYGLVDTNNSPTYYGYALSQFSKFVRPGYERVSATAIPASGVSVSAYKGNGNYVIVAINSNSSTNSVSFAIANQTLSSFTPYQTSASGGIVQLSTVNVSNNVFTYSLPAQSITTFVATASATPSFTLSRSASALSIAQGGSGTDTITVTGTGGFTGSVTLAASGLPSGVTAMFGTNPTTGASLLTLTASATAIAGTSTVTITGTSGTLTASTTIALTITSGPIGVACHIGYTISSQWSGGFGAAITIDNTGTTALASWTLTWTFANGQTITQLWNGNETQSGANVTVTNMSYNGSIPAGGSYSGMGFNGTWNNTTNAVPTSFAVNGVTCK